MQFTKGQAAWNKGLKHSPLTIEKFRAAKLGTTGSRTNNWKGEKAKYSAIHMWVRKMLGKPSLCENCGSDSRAPRYYHWANISGKYLRDLKDWARLCAKCHKAYDTRKRALQKKSYAME
jgi:hypothetical protein